jgi:leader peptidase (prepilin peptidase) / N-methyltransferase
MHLAAILDVALCLWASIPIISYDLRYHLITNRSLLRFSGMVLLLKFVEFGGGVEMFIEIIQDGAKALVLFLIIYLLSGASMGLGDVKLAPILAALAGIGTAKGVAIWVSLIWIWGGVHALLSALRYRTFRQRIAFAPALFTGTLTYLAMGIWSSLPQ